jgi:uncharacterized membrane protein
MVGWYLIRTRRPLQLLFDLGFLALGAVLLAGGWTLCRSGLTQPDQAILSRPGPARP